MGLKKGLTLCRHRQKVGAINSGEVAAYPEDQAERLRRANAVVFVDPSDTKKVIRRTKAEEDAEYAEAARRLRVEKGKAEGELFTAEDVKEMLAESKQVSDKASRAVRDAQAEAEAAKERAKAFEAELKQAKDDIKALSADLKRASERADSLASERDALKKSLDAMGKPAASGGGGGPGKK